MTKLLDLMLLLRSGLLASKTYKMEETRYTNGASTLETKIVDTTTNKVYLVTIEVIDGIHEAGETNQSAKAQA